MSVSEVCRSEFVLPGQFQDCLQMQERHDRLQLEMEQTCEWLVKVSRFPGPTVWRKALRNCWIKSPQGSYRLTGCCCFDWPANQMEKIFKHRILLKPCMVFQLFWASGATSWLYRQAGESLQLSEWEWKKFFHTIFESMLCTVLASI